MKEIAMFMGLFIAIIALLYMYSQYVSDHIEEFCKKPRTFHELREFSCLIHKNSNACYFFYLKPLLKRKRIRPFFKNKDIQDEKQMFVAVNRE